MRVHSIIIAFICTCGIILLSYQLITLRTTIQSQETGAQGKTSISHELFLTPYNEGEVPFTDLSDSATKVRREFWKSHKPSYKCPPKLLSRVGKEKGDGGKWMCGLENFGRLTADEQYPCVFYSFGVSSDSTFESGVLQATTCSVYAYDIRVHKIGRPLKPSNPRVHFHRMGVAGHDNSTMKTLKTLMDENGHTFIDILKVDVETWEYVTFNKFFEDFPGKLPFGQLMIELHNEEGKKWTLEGVKKVLGLVEKLERRGCRVFSIEPNVYSIDNCSEFSFINLHYRRLFIPDDQ